MGHVHRRRRARAVLTIAVMATVFAGLVVLSRLPAPAPVVVGGTLERPGTRPPPAPRTQPPRLTVPAADHPGPVAANGVVVRLVDGDTLVVRIAGRDEVVRLLGIDTPETHRPNTAVECFGPEAAAALAGALPPGTPVHLERDVEARDRYGRLLAYVVRAGDGLFVNAALARAGFADALAYPPNLAHADEVAAAVASARDAGAGLWSACGGAHEPARR